MDKGDKIKLTIKHNDKPFEIKGVVKEVRTSYGREEVLLDEGTVAPFWTRKAELDEGN